MMPALLSLLACLTLLLSGLQTEASPPALRKTPHYLPVDFGAAHDLVNVNMLVNGVGRRDVARPQNQRGRAVENPGSIRPVGDATQLRFRAKSLSANLQNMLRERVIERRLQRLCLNMAFMMRDFVAERG